MIFLSIDVLSLCIDISVSLVLSFGRICCLVVLLSCDLLIDYIADDHYNQTTKQPDNSTAKPTLAISKITGNKYRK